MEHPNIRTLHFDDVPRSMAKEITTLSDLTWHFGPQGEGFFGQDLRKVAREKLGMDLLEMQGASGDVVETAILDGVARHGSHTLLVLQVHPNPIEGYVCLVANPRLGLVDRVLSRVPGRERQI
ncbi:hypothetical protein [Deinococcus roseus]|uniref:Uncharacterized protein n=1 Tax=Deinococcus roseus TaxID=392414 RepID=A0ABQ2DFU2_9DEIO|nr:hypothetical protein [Deinococcus roseus]GGJ52935.1 hypothetical protein GCM10008938_43650 [Deinococcus roseus]